MKKLVLCVLFTSSLASMPPYTLDQKLGALDQYCQKHYGRPHPFMAMLTSFSLLTELATTCRDTPELARHLPELMVFLQQADPLLNDAICAFAANTDRPTALRPLLDLSQKATSYITEHLRQEAAKSATVRQQGRREKRMIEAILGVALVGGAVKYIILGACGLTGLFVLDRIYKTITNSVKVSNDNIADYRGQVDRALRRTCIDLYQYTCQQSGREPDQEIVRNRPPLKTRIGRRFGRIGRSLKRGFKRIMPFMNPDTVREPTHTATRTQAQRSQQGLEAVIAYLRENKERYQCTDAELGRINGSALARLTSNHPNAGE